jgi:hypothetical protein
VIEYPNHKHEIDDEAARRRAMEALGELAGKLITAPDAAGSGADCGCGLGADRCRAAEDGDFGD